MKPRALRRRVPLARIAGVLLIAFTPITPAQTLHLRGHVRDSSGRPAPGASVIADGLHGEAKATTDADGRFEVEVSDGPLTLRATAHAMETDPMQLAAAATGEIELVLHPSAVSQQITVTATRSAVDLPATANTVYALRERQFDGYPAAQLDDKLRQQAGFELFRRSSSRVQNPTSQGISLRGLGSTAASRTLVLEDSVPLNDPFGGWIHWDEIPAEAVQAVTIATGGGSDLYGSSALGGVIDVVPARPSAVPTAGPTAGRLDASAAGGGQQTSLAGVRGDASGAQWSQLLAADWFRTAGYIPTAPSVAGPVDVPANLHYQAAHSETDRTYRAAGRVFLIGNMLNEARGNGTPLTDNATRLWRYIAGDDWSAGPIASGRVRLFGSDEGYRQSFSSVSSPVNAPRSAETLTRLQSVRTQEVGGASDATFALSPVALVAGADVRDIRATDDENPIASGAPSGVADSSARQRFIGGFAEALAAHKAWSAALSLRLDAVSNFNTRVITEPSSVAQPVLTPDRSEFIASPRLGVVRQLPANAALHASVFRAFRSPTMNELYRTGQVGAQITEANPQLQSERATGWELGATYASPRGALALGATYFWTEINRPVSAVLLSTNLYLRENLGQILSQGTELHLDLRPRKAISATFGYQYAHAVVTRFSAQPALVGNWIPEVPRQSFTAQLRAQSSRLGELTLAARAGGRAFDDSANTFVLASFFQLDLSARHDFHRRWTATLTLQDLLNQRPDVARTPTLTLGSGFLAQAGVAIHWDRNSTH
jgi:outer membrane receptor protein involved in Fe transport